MQTFYVDIYFLINFTVDLLALYFAAYFSKIPTTAPRLLISAIIGAFTAVAAFFTQDSVLLTCAATLLGLIVMSAVGVGRASLRRRIKFAFAFLMFSALVGGAAYFLWDILDRAFAGGLPINDESVNGKLLMFSIVILVCIGVFRMFVSLFSSNGTERALKIRIDFLGKTVDTEAFIDSGNLAVDPMDMRPVLILKPNVARAVFPEAVIHLSDPDKLDREVRKRVRLIPISRFGATHVLTGLRTDGVYVISEEGETAISVTVAIDREEGDFGGYQALMPASAIENI